MTGREPQDVYAAVMDDLIGSDPARGSVGRIAETYMLAERVVRTVREWTEPSPDRFIPCQICGHENVLHDNLSVDQWLRHRESEYEGARDHGADKHNAESYADREMSKAYGPMPAGPIRPFGPWLTDMPMSYDFSWHDEREVEIYAPQASASS